MAEYQDKLSRTLHNTGLYAADIAVTIPNLGYKVPIYGYCMNEIGFKLGFTHDTVHSSYPMHAHDGLEIVWHVGGNGADILTSGETQSFAPNSVVIHGHACAHAQQNTKTGIDRCMLLSVPSELNQQIGEFIHIPNVMNQVLQQEMQFLSSNRKHPPQMQHICDLRAAAVLYGLLELHADTQRNNSKTVEDSMYKAEQYIREHFSQIQSNREVAQFIGLSEDYFRHQFKDRFSVSPMDHVLNCRFEHAKQLLVHTSLTQQAIAEQSGFQNIRYFNTRFSHYMGLSPGRYRKQHQV